MVEVAIAMKFVCFVHDIMYCLSCWSLLTAQVIQSCVTKLTSGGQTKQQTRRTWTEL